MPVAALLLILTTIALSAGSSLAAGKLLLGHLESPELAYVLVVSLGLLIGTSILGCVLRAFTKD